MVTDIYANRDNTPGFAGGMDVHSGTSRTPSACSYEKFHNLICGWRSGKIQVYNGYSGARFPLSRRMDCFQDRINCSPGAPISRISSSVMTEAGLKGRITFAMATA